MQERQLDELKAAAAARLEDLFKGERVLAQQVISSEIEQKVARGDAFVLTDEEERLLRAFRGFKPTCKPGAVFKWQTHPGDDLALGSIVEATETALIRDPQEVS